MGTSDDARNYRLVIAKIGELKYQPIETLSFVIPKRAAQRNLLSLDRSALVVFALWWGGHPGNTEDVSINRHGAGN
jgi:hypothetical protein